MLALKDIVVKYGDDTIVENLSLEINKGQLGCLLGPSGCGKSTLLRAIAGFEPLFSGSVSIANQVVEDLNINIPAEKRGTGIVFQDYALFPHLTVRDNIIFGIKHLAIEERTQRLSYLADIASVSEYLDRYPHELSGGQQQRVALARALARRPDFLLLDEPFSNLDTKLRERLSTEVREILIRENITALLVTHDQNEAFSFADSVNVMLDGRIVDSGSPHEIYHTPQHPFTAGFIGKGRVISGKIRDDSTVSTSIGDLPYSSTKQLNTGLKVDVLVRAENVESDNKGPISGIVKERAFQGAKILYTLEIAVSETIQALFPNHLQFEIGDRVNVCLGQEPVVCFARM